MALCNTIIIIIITWPVGSHCRPVMALCNTIIINNHLARGRLVMALCHTIIIIITWPVARW